MLDTYALLYTRSAIYQDNSDQYDHFKHIVYILDHTFSELSWRAHYGCSWSENQVLIITTKGIWYSRFEYIQSSSRYVFRPPFKVFNFLINPVSTIGPVLGLQLIVHDFPVMAIGRLLNELEGEFFPRGPRFSL